MTTEGELQAALARVPWLRRAQISENVMRKDYTETEKARLTEELIGYLDPKRGTEAKRVADATDFAPERTLDAVAGLLGEEQVRTHKRLAVYRAAQDEPETYGHLLADMDRSGKVNGAYKQLGKLRAAKAIAAEPAPTALQGPYRVIVADPPWLYHNRAADLTHRGALPYPEMDIPAICTLQPAGRYVQELAATDAILWLWTTNAHMREAFDVVAAWGFEQKTILTWVKDKMGVGDWLRGQTEHCLFAVRGKPTVTLTNQTTVISGPVREHSRKPDEFYALVEALCPGGKLELFSREPRSGWDAWGGEKDYFNGA